MRFYLQSSNCKKIYRVQYQEGQFLVQSCISVDEQSSIHDFDVYNGRVYATLIKQKKKTFTIAVANQASDVFNSEKQIDQIEDSFQINTHLFKVIDTFKEIEFNYIIVSYLLKKQDNQNQLKVIMIDLNQNLQDNSEILEKRIAIGTISSTMNRAENIQALQFKKSVQMKRNNKVFVPLYEKTVLGNENIILVSTIQLQKAEIGCMQSDEEQCNNLFQQLVLQKNQIYDKNYILQKPNVLIEQYIQKQIQKIPNYIHECNNSPLSSRVQQYRYDTDSLIFLYLLIINKQHTLLTDIINTRTMVRKNEEVCEYLILNLEGLEKELSFLLFKSHILKYIQETDFLSLQKDDYQEFYQLVQIINEIFNSILVRKQKEAFEDMRERNLPCYSAEHQRAIADATLVIEQIASQICIIKISGWLLDQQIEGQSLSQLLFSSNDSVNLTQQSIASKISIQHSLLLERNDLLSLDKQQERTRLFCDIIFEKFGFVQFDPISMIKSEESKKSIGINLHSFALYRYLYELSCLDNNFKSILKNYESELATLSNNGYVSSVNSTSNGHFFRCLCSIDDLKETNRIDIFKQIIDNSKAIAQLDPEFIVYIICTFAAHSFKDEVFLLIRQFNKSVDWLQGNYPSVLLNLYLKFQNVSQAIQFGLALKNCTRQVAMQNQILCQLIEKIISRRQEEYLFRQELNPFQDKDIVDAFQMITDDGNVAIMLVYIKYLIYRNQYFTAMDVFENYQKTIADVFSKEEIDLILALFSAILKQFSAIQISQLLSQYTFLSKSNAHKSEYQPNHIQDRIQFAHGESSVIKLHNIQQRNYSKKKKNASAADDDFLVLLNFDKKQEEPTHQDQMNIEQDIHMTPQSKERLESNQNTKSKRKWTTSKKNPSPQ